MCGTERQRAVIAAFKMRPEAAMREIGDAAGVTQGCAAQVIAEYLESQKRDRALACKSPTRQLPTVAKRDVASWQPDRRFGGNSGPAACTAKQQALNIALAEHPRRDGELKMDYCRRIAAIAGVSPAYVHNNLQVREAQRLGRERVAAETANRLPVVASLNQRAVQVPPFVGWADVFSRFKLLSEAYLRLAMSRGDKYAESFLKDLRDHADRAETRSWLDRSTQ
jgi:hypothetical protein